MTWSENPRHQGLRKRLVDALKIKGIRDERVLAAIGKVPRHAFLESTFINFAYRDQAFPIGAGQTISQPYTVAFQSELLMVEPYSKVLEVGTGSGYQAAVLCEMGAKVYTIERQKELFVKASQLLQELGYFPAFHFGDGFRGLPTYGPFDRIIVTAGATSVPEELKTQLVIGGRMVIPVGPDRHQEMLVVIRTGEAEYVTEKHGGFIFVPLLRGVIN
jgi:protein-L-isoaspartate(D-aspartate) O-methyltransferase